MIVFAILFFITFILLIIKSRKLKKLKNEKYVSDNEFIVNMIHEYDKFKNKAIITDSTEIKSVMYGYFDIFDNLYHEYLYPKLGVEESEEDT